MHNIRISLRQLCWSKGFGLMTVAEEQMEQLQPGQASSTELLLLRCSSCPNKIPYAAHFSQETLPPVAATTWQGARNDQGAGSGKAGKQESSIAASTTASAPVAGSSSSKHNKLAEQFKSDGNAGSGVRCTVLKGCICI